VPDLDPLKVRAGFFAAMAPQRLEVCPLVTAKENSHEPTRYNTIRHLLRRFQLSSNS